MTKNIWIFFLCTILVFITQFNLLQPILQYRLFNITEDWPFLILYKSLYPTPWSKIIDVWTSEGMHITAQIYHIGILSDFLRYNYHLYQVVNVILKTIGTLSIFPLIYILFKNIRLAFLTTALFGITSATTGSFGWVVKGSEYIGIALMNLFFITYYFTILKNSYKFLFLSTILIMLSYLMAPPRMFPLPLIVLLSEVCWVIKTKKLKNIKNSISRVIILILPIYLISKPAPVSSMPFTSRPGMLLQDIESGNWHNFLDPFAGIGWSLFTNDFLKFLGSLEMNTFMNFYNFWTFLIKPTLIFAITTFILSFILSKNKMKFFTIVFFGNFILDILMFLLANHQYNTPKNLKLPSDGHFIFTKYPTIVGLYIYSVVIGCFFEWRKQQNNMLLLAIWLGPLFAMVFLGPTWVIMGPLVNDWSSTHWYFGIPAMGTTLFLAAILILLYEKLKRLQFIKRVAIFIITLIVVVFYQEHGVAINRAYMGLNPEKIKLTDQQALHEKLISKLGSSVKEGNLLIYFDIAEDKVNLRRTPQYYKEALVVTKFGYWVHFMRGEDGKVNNGCIEAIIDKKTLKSAVELKESRKGFSYKGICVNKGNSPYNPDKVFYDLKSFRAYKIQDGEFIDIRDEVLKDLGLYPV